MPMSLYESALDDDDSSTGSPLDGTPPSTDFLDTPSKPQVMIQEILDRDPKSPVKPTSNFHRRRLSSMSEFSDPFTNAEIYYGPQKKNHNNSQHNNNNNGTANSENDTSNGNGRQRVHFRNKSRTMSVANNVSEFKKGTYKNYTLKRRGSEDDTYLSSQGTRQFFIEDVDATLEDLLRTEDTDKNYQITIEDTGPKVLKVGTANSNGFKFINVRGTYMLSNLLQELTIAKNMGRHQIILDEARINENPVNRLTRLINEQFWSSLTRKIDFDNIAEIAGDTKIDSPKAKVPRIYVPYKNEEQYAFYIEASQKNPSLHIEVEYLPEKITPEYVKSINDTPGFLALAMEEHFDPSTGNMSLMAYPYCVPGGRFNELYGWDSYFIALGLLESNKVDIAKGMVEHFIFEIENYGKILNANRSYYLCRSQPPFLTDMALQVFSKIGGKSNRLAIKFLKKAFTAAIKEYKSIWMSVPRLDPITGLSCYHPDGDGIPPETEPEHFDAILTPYAIKHNKTIQEFRILYNEKKIYEPALDEFFLHDRAVRESGHDTTYRFEGVCAYLATIDLNSLLYKYEVDIADVIEEFYNDKFIDPYDNSVSTSADWRKAAEKRKQTIYDLMWDEETGFFFDYNINIRERTSYESATTFWALWAGLATRHQADVMVEKALPRLEVLGGLVACTEESRGPISVTRPPRQWDYPFGWAPQQILAWDGLCRYGYSNVATRLSYRWLYMMTKAFVDYNGIVVEKYDVTKGTDPHRVEAEYGNQGADFKGVAMEGFGWVNTSYLLGLKYQNLHARRALASCIPPVPFFNRLKDSERFKYGL